MRLGAIYNGSSAHHRAIHEPKYARWLAGSVYLPDLPDADLGEFDGLLLPERSHRELLERARPNLLRFLERGGTLVIFGDQSVYGPQPKGWLPGIDWVDGAVNYWWWRQPKPESGLTGHLPDHSLWRYLDLAAATWHQHGGFRAPPGAEVLVTNRDELAILYVDRQSTPGTLVVTSLDPMYHYGSYFMPATERFLDGFLPWLVTEMPGREFAVADLEGAV